MYSSSIGGPPVYGSGRKRNNDQQHIHNNHNYGKLAASTKDERKDHDDEHDIYPHRITYVLSTLRILCGGFLVALGVLAHYLKASYSGPSSGIWGGILVIIAGVFGVCSVRMRYSRSCYVLVFFVACVLSTITDVLIVIYSSTGLARDLGFPGGFVRDDVTGELVPVSQMEIPTHEKAMMVNLLLIITGVLDVMFTLPCFIICLREIFQCYGPPQPPRRRHHLKRQYHHHQQQHNEWLLSWLGQQHQRPHLQQPQHVYYSKNSGFPFFGGGGGSSHPFYVLPSEPSSSAMHLSPQQLPSPQPPPLSPQHFYSSPRESSRGSGRKRRPRSLSPEGQPLYIPPASQLQYPPFDLYAAAAPYYYHMQPPPYPSPGSSHSMAQLLPASPHSPPPTTWYFAPPPPQPPHYPPQEELDFYHLPPLQPHFQFAHRTSRRKRDRSGSEQRRKKSKAGPTDSDLDKTYTGLDRELAEEFIEQTMEAEDVNSEGGGKQKQIQRRAKNPPQSPLSGTATESEAW